MSGMAALSARGAVQRPHQTQWMLGIQYKPEIQIHPTHFFHMSGSLGHGTWNEEEQSGATTLKT